MDKEEAEIVGCTFKPILITKHKENLEIDQPRYDQLYTKHKEKIQVLEQRRKEIEIEEKRMHETVERMKNDKPYINASKPPFDDKYNKLRESYQATLARKEALAKQLINVTSFLSYRIRKLYLVQEVT